MSFICIGFAKGMAIICSVLSLFDIWYSNQAKQLANKYRFTILIFYAVGAFLAPVITRSLLRPFIHEYRQFYEAPNKEFLKKFLITNQSFITTTSTRTTSFKSIKTLFTPTQTPTTQPKLITQSILSIDFLRLAEEGGDGLYRLFGKYFSYIFYVITAMNAILVILFSVLFLIESKVFINKQNQQNLNESIGMQKKEIFSITSSTPSTVENLSKFEIIMKKISNFKILIPNKPMKPFSNLKNMFINIFLFIFLIIFYSLIYTSFKLESTYLLSYSIQQEYVERYYDDYFKDIFVYTTTTSASFNQLFSFNKSYNFLSLTLVNGSYLLMVFYLGIIIGLGLNFLLISKTSLRSIFLLYFNILLHALTQFATIFLITIFTSNSLSEPVKHIIWFFIQFSNGFFLSATPVLFFDHFSLKTFDQSTSAPGEYFIKNKYLTACELIGLSIGAGIFQWLMTILNKLNNNFNSFINIIFLNSIASIVIFFTLHICLLIINKRKNFVSPN